jgi:LDH2 family malate/lactate/ureidoglycolate dehydrogenase
MGTDTRFDVPEHLAVRVAYDDMAAAATAIFAGLGMSSEDARRAADVLLYADVRGIDSHGVSNMFPYYATWFRSGLLDPRAAPRVVREAPAVATVDDRRGLGLATCHAAMDLAIAKAAECGVGAVSVTNSGHFGAAAYWAHKALDHGMIGVAMTVGGVQVVPTFGSKAMLGLNPIAVAAPAATLPPFVFDASMSSVAGNKIRIARRLGATVAPGWIALPDGTPVMEESPVPESFLMLPLGGTRELGSHKGYGLALVVDILAGLLSGTGPGYLTSAAAPSPTTSPPTGSTPSATPISSGATSTPNWPACATARPPPAPTGSSTPGYRSGRPSRTAGFAASPTTPTSSTGSAPPPPSSA